MVRTPDILAQVATLRHDRQFILGFAAETENLLDNASDKLRRKNLDLIVANDAQQAMGAPTNQITLIDARGGIEELPLLSKQEVAARILDRVMAFLDREEDRAP
jgi:phosphopantothenoylcysteine decarboxylase/phosphopantothenate--cysteine ligase